MSSFLAVIRTLFKDYNNVFKTFKYKGYSENVNLKMFSFNVMRTYKKYELHYKNVP